MLWVDLSSIESEELATVHRALRLSDRAVAALEADPTEARATVFEDAVEVVVPALVDGLDSGPTVLQVLVGDAWVITRHAEPMPFLDEHRESIRDERPIGQLSPVEFLVSVLDWHVDSFFRAAEELEAEVDKLDDAALRTERDLLDRLVSMRRKIARVRHTLSQNREVFAELARADFLPDLEARENEALAGVARRLDRAGEAVAYTREMLIGTFDVHMTRTAQRTNDIMRVLTLASVVLLPSVVLAGIMGMNFQWASSRRRTCSGSSSAPWCSWRSGGSASPARVDGSDAGLRRDHRGREDSVAISPLGAAARVSQGTIEAPTT